MTETKKSQAGKEGVSLSSGVLFKFDSISLRNKKNFGFKIFKFYFSENKKTKYLIKRIMKNKTIDLYFYSSEIEKLIEFLFVSKSIQKKDEDKGEVIFRYISPDFTKTNGKYGFKLFKYHYEKEKKTKYLIKKNKWNKEKKEYQMNDFYIYSDSELVELLDGLIKAKASKREE